MIRPEPDVSTITKKAQAAFRDVQQSVIERAKQTQTPIIVFTDNRIQAITAEEFEETGRNKGRDVAEGA